MLDLSVVPNDDNTKLQYDIVVGGKPSRLGVDHSEAGVAEWCHANATVSRKIEAPNR
jgi:hypothetical protein